MKKESEKESWISPFVSSLFDVLQGVVFEGLVSNIRAEVDATIERAKKRLDESHKLLLQNLVFTVLVLGAVTMVLIGIIYWLIETAGMQKAHAFMLIGSLVFVSALVFEKLMSMKNKLREVKDAS